MFAGCGEQVLAALQNQGTPSGMQDLCRVPAETIETCTIFARREKFRRQKRPPFWGPFRGQAARTQANQIETGWMTSILGSVSGPQNGGRFVGKIFVNGRKIAQVSIVSPGTRQKFSTPLGFHGFAAPRACSPHPANIYVHTCS